MKLNLKWKNQLFDLQHNTTDSSAPTLVDIQVMDYPKSGSKMESHHQFPIIHPVHPSKILGVLCSS